MASVIIEEEFSLVKLIMVLDMIIKVIAISTSVALCV